MLLTWPIYVGKLKLFMMSHMRSSDDVITFFFSFSIFIYFFISSLI